jgi:hypothetical protein
LLWRKDRLDFRCSRLSDLENLLLFLLQAHRVVIAHGCDLLILVVDDIRDFLFLVGSELQLFVNGRPSSLLRARLIAG